MIGPGFVSILVSAALSPIGIPDIPASHWTRGEWRRAVAIVGATAEDPLAGLRWAGTKADPINRARMKPFRNSGLTRIIAKGGPNTPGEDYVEGVIAIRKAGAPLPTAEDFDRSIQIGLVLPVEKRFTRSEVVTKLGDDRYVASRLMPFGIKGPSYDKLRRLELRRLERLGLRRPPTKAPGIAETMGLGGVGLATWILCLSPLSQLDRRRA